MLIIYSNFFLVLQTSNSSPGEKQGTINLPHDYSPVSLLTAVEMLHAFTGPQAQLGLVTQDTISQAAQCKQAVAARRQQEMQVHINQCAYSTRTFNIQE